MSLFSSWCVTITWIVLKWSKNSKFHRCHLVKPACPCKHFLIFSLSAKRKRNSTKYQLFSRCLIHISFIRLRDMNLIAFIWLGGQVLECKLLKKTTNATRLAAGDILTGTKSWKSLPKPAWLHEAFGMQISLVATHKLAAGLNPRLPTCLNSSWCFLCYSLKIEFLMWTTKFALTAMHLGGRQWVANFHY